MDALPVRHRRPGDQAGSEQVRPQNGHHEGLIARLTVADGEWARRLRMEFDHALEEPHLSLDDVEELLAGCGRRPKADEIDRMTRIEGVADLAFRLESAYARPLAGPRVHHHDRPFSLIDCDAGRRDDARQRVVDRARQRATVYQQLMTEAQYRRHRPRRDLNLFVPALTQQVEKKDAALECVKQVLRPGSNQLVGTRAERELETRPVVGFAFDVGSSRDLHGLFPSRSVGSRATLIDDTTLIESPEAALIGINPTRTGWTDERD